jgi:hypothetical protein
VEDKLKGPWEFIEYKNSMFTVLEVKDKNNNKVIANFVANDEDYPDKKRLALAISKIPDLLKLFATIKTEVKLKDQKENNSDDQNMMINYLIKENSEELARIIKEIEVDLNG